MQPSLSLKMDLSRQHDTCSKFCAFDHLQTTGCNLRLLISPPPLDHTHLIWLLIGEFVQHTFSSVKETYLVAFKSRLQRSNHIVLVSSEITWAGTRRNADLWRNMCWTNKHIKIFFRHVNIAIFVLRYFILNHHIRSATQGPTLGPQRSLSATVDPSP